MAEKGGRKKNKQARKDKFLAQSLYKSGKYEGKNAAVRIIMDEKLDYAPRTIQKWLKEVRKNIPT